MSASDASDASDAVEGRSLRQATLTASEVRMRVREEHRRLRIQLVSLQNLARMATIDDYAARALRPALRALLVEFALHLESEEEMLLPLIERVDAWGAERAARMREEHRIQRALLRDMFARADAHAGMVALSEEADALVLRIFHDMRDEEAELLDETLLRDDAIAIDQNCG